MDEVDRIKTRTSNWNVRRLSLQRSNALDISYDPPQREWSVNNTFESVDAPTVRQKFRIRPIAILHDNRDVIWNSIVMLSSSEDKTLIEKQFNLIASRRDKRFKVYPIELNSQPFLFIETGVGSGATNMVVEILSALEISPIVKVGTCSALQKDLREGDVILVRHALDDEGASKYDYSYVPNINELKKSQPYDTLTNILYQKLSQVSNPKYSIYEKSNRPTMLSVDSYESFDISTDFYLDIKDHDVLGVEMECSALFSCCQKYKIPCAALITVSRSQEHLISKFNHYDQRVKDDLAKKVTAIQCSLISDLTKILSGMVVKT